MSTDQLSHRLQFFTLLGSTGGPDALHVLCVQILQLLQWRDRFWDVCSMLPADSQGISVLSLHWQWVQKHLILRLPQLLLGEAAATSEYASSVLS